MIGVVPPELANRLTPTRWSPPATGDDADGDLAREVLGPGVWGILPTPFTEDLKVDLASIQRVVTAFVDARVTGLVALGVFGEAARLDLDEQVTVLRAVVDAAGDVPVIAGVSPVEEEASRAAAEHLVDQVPATAGLMIKVPSEDSEVSAAHLRRVTDATGRRLVVQDYPADSGVRITPDALIEAVVESDVALAVKAEAAPTPVAIARIVSAVDVPVFGGLGGIGLIDELMAGAAGAMTGFSHPEVLVAAVEAFDAGGYDAVRAMFAPWLPLVNFEGQVGIGLAIRKEILQRRGMIACAAVRPPAPGLPHELVATLGAHLAAVGQPGVRLP